MSRIVCGICWCPYDEDTGECACPPPVVRDGTALLWQALEALEADDSKLWPNAIEDLRKAVWYIEREIAKRSK